jgi:hypothetical protein
LTTFFRRNPVSLCCAAISAAASGRFPGPITADAIVAITPADAAPLVAGRHCHTILVAGPDYQTISVAVTAHAVVSVTVATDAVISVTILESVIAVAAPRGQIISVTITATPSLIVSIVITHVLVARSITGRARRARAASLSLHLLTRRCRRRACAAR